MSALIMIKNKVSPKFAKTLGNSLFYSKLLYHVELWGLTTITNISKIDRLITKMARILNGTEGYGKTDQWNIKHLNWMSLRELHSFTAAKYAHKIINSDSKHWFKEYLLANRS